MKRNSKLFVLVGVLITIVIGVTFAYFLVGVVFQGDGANTTGETAQLIKVQYDAGTSALNATGLYPGKTVSKQFKVTVTPGSDTNEATYAIKLNITENTFVKCDDTNYDSITNACIKGANDLIYTLKDSSNNVIATGDLTGKTGDVILTKETKTVSTKTDYNYTLEITFKDTGADQNHNKNKTINGNIKVEFSEPPITIQDILATKNISTRTDFSQPLTVNTTGTIYTAEDNDGTSYYYAGAVNDNWVKFGKNKSNEDLYWRIIRINGDNTVRMIYAGIDSKVTTGEGTQIGTITFNSAANDNMYVGYMYEGGVVHGLQNNSTIKNSLDNWYDDNLANYASYIDVNAGFCGDRGSTTIDGGETNETGGTGTTITYYAGYYRLHTNKTPNFKCKDEKDLYTPIGSNKGNAKLTKPIGLISADEVAYAGGIVGIANNTYYLYNNQNYWTITPRNFDGTLTRVFRVNINGLIANSGTTGNAGIRPVINLKADTLFNNGTTGTADNPYTIVGLE